MIHVDRSALAVALPEISSTTPSNIHRRPGNVTVSVQPSTGPFVGISVDDEGPGVLRRPNDPGDFPQVHTRRRCPEAMNVKGTGIGLDAGRRDRSSAWRARSR